MTWAFRVADSFTFTVNTSTDVATATGWTPVNGSLIRVTSTNTLPSPLFFEVQWYIAPYYVCNVSGNTFQFYKTSCSGTLVDLTSTGTGTHSGHIASTTATNIYLDSISGSGWPAGITLSIKRAVIASRCNEIPTVISGKYRLYESNQNRYTICLYATATTSVTPGSYTPTLTVCSDTGGVDCSSYTFNIEVIAPPSPVYAKPASVPVIPGLAQYTNNLTDAAGGGGDGYGGAAFCNKNAPSTTPPSGNVPQMNGCEGCVGYYDGARVYYQIADATGDTAWKTGCAMYLIDEWKESYVDPNGGGVPGYKLFTDSLFRAISDNEYGKHSGKYKKTINYLMTKTTNTEYGTLMWYGLQRENAYALKAMVNQRKYYGTIHQYYEDHLNTVISEVLACTEVSNPCKYQSFMLGLELEALIAHWEVTKDYRIPYVVKRGIDHIWAQGDWVTNHSMMYNTGASLSESCVNEADYSQVSWFLNEHADGCQLTNRVNDRKLMLLIAPAFAWYWYISGDDTYRVQGDELFFYAHFFADGTTRTYFTAKEFSQMYRWAPAYVRWRQAR